MHYDEKICARSYCGVFTVIITSLLCSNVWLNGDNDHVLSDPWPMIFVIVGNFYLVRLGKGGGGANQQLGFVNF